MNIQTPASRRTDPETSYLAEEYINKGKRLTHQQIITGHVEIYPGRTAGEIGEATGLGQVECSRRLAELNGVTVKRDGTRKCRVKGSRMGVWYPK